MLKPLLAIAAALAAASPVWCQAKPAEKGLGDWAFVGWTNRAQGDYLGVTDSKLGFGFGVRGIWRLDSGIELPVELGFGFDPGTNRLVSTYGSDATGGYPPATGVNPSRFELRNRRTDVQALRIGTAYRRSFQEQYYWQAGARILLSLTKVTDTGSILVTNGNAITSTTDPDIIGIEAIASEKRKSSVELSPYLGVGTNIGSNYSVELNLAFVRAANPDLSANTLNAPGYRKNFSGPSIEFAFIARF